MPDESPLVQALKNKREGSAGSDPQALLEFILSHFDLVPKDGAEEGDEKPDMVMTQESRVP